MTLTNSYSWLHAYQDGGGDYMTKLRRELAMLEPTVFALEVLKLNLLQGRNPAFFGTLYRNPTWYSKPYLGYSTCACL